MIRRIKAWFARGKVSDTLNIAIRRADKAEQNSRRILSVLDQKIEEIERLRSQQNSLRSRIDILLDELDERVGISKNVIRSQNETIAGLRSDIQVANDITIPALVASHQLVLERVEADTAIQIRTKVATQMPVEGGSN